MGEMIEEMVERETPAPAKEVPVGPELASYRAWAAGQPREEARLPFPLAVLAEGRVVYLTHCRHGIWHGVDSDQHDVQLGGGLGGVDRAEPILSWLRFLNSQTIPQVGGEVGPAARLARVEARLRWLESLPADCIDRMLIGPLREDARALSDLAVEESAYFCEENGVA